MIVIEGGTVLTADDADHVYAPGHVVIEEDRVTAVGPGRYRGPGGVTGTRSAEKTGAAEVIDAAGMVVMPGLIDLHYHTAIGKGLCDHLPLWESLEQFWYPSIRALDAETAYWAAAASYLESVKCGVTTVNDMYRRVPDLARAAADIGIRAVLSNDVALDEHNLDTLQDNKDAHDAAHGSGDGRESCDVVVSNVLLLDPVLGVRSVSIGVREGRVSGIGRAGNPDTTDGVDVVVGASTIVVPGEGMIATPGAVDTHVHLLSPRICEAALASGVTTVLGQEFGPFWGPGVNTGWGLRTAYRAFDAWPVNVGFLGRGSSSRPEPLLEALEAGVCAFKVHEDFGAHRRTLDTALGVADAHDVQVCLHTDGLNENLALEDTLAVIGGRSVHAYHVEGCGGGHVPNVLELAGVPNVVGSSTNPTLPFARDAVAEHQAMIMHVHGLAASQEQLARDRVRAATMAAETVLHDLGVIPVTSSDAQGMGRVGETIRRTFAMAAVNKAARGQLPEDEPDADNGRVLRYLAKLTINPAITHGIAHEVGSLEVGKLADLVLWRPAWFGAKPSYVLKAGLVAWAATGDPNAAIDTAQPLVLGPQFAGSGAAPPDVSVVFVNQAAAEAGDDAVPTRRRRVAVRGTRSVGLADMRQGNDRTGAVVVSPRSRTVTLDGDPLQAEPVDHVALTRLYHL